MRTGTRQRLVTLRGWRRLIALRCLSGDADACHLDYKLARLRTIQLEHEDALPSSEHEGTATHGKVLTDRYEKTASVRVTVYAFTRR